MIKFLSKCCWCHQANQKLLAELLTEVISQQRMTSSKCARKYRQDYAIDFIAKTSFISFLSSLVTYSSELINLTKTIFVRVFLWTLMCFVMTRCAISSWYFWIHSETDIATALGRGESINFRDIRSSYEGCGGNGELQHAVHVTSPRSSVRSLSSTVIHADAGDGGGYIAESIRYVCTSVDSEKVSITEK